jgi:hypothetical protein
MVAGLVVSTLGCGCNHVTVLSSSQDERVIHVAKILTKPIVHLTRVEPAYDESETKTVLICWSATDENLGARPITISYAEQQTGPWIPIATNIANNGRYFWEMSSHSPIRFFVRVEAADLAGNVGAAQTQEAILIDYSQPTVSVISVESMSDERLRDDAAFSTRYAVKETRNGLLSCTRWLNLLGH